MNIIQTKKVMQDIYRMSCITFFVCMILQLISVCFFLTLLFCYKSQPQIKLLYQNFEESRSWWWWYYIINWSLVDSKDIIHIHGTSYIWIYCKISSKTVSKYRIELKCFQFLVGIQQPSNNVFCWFTIYQFSQFSVIKMFYFH